MRTNKWVRNPAVDDAYFEMHGIKPEISYDRVNNDKYSVKIALNSKEVILTETMKEGLTDTVTLEYDGNKEMFSSMNKAELKANEILGSE